MMHRTALAWLVLLSAGIAFGSADRRAAWENGGRAETLDWFRREMFGYAPDRPADETFEADGVSFAGGEIKIRIHCKLPEGASADNPAPAFLLLDHYNGATRSDGLWHRPGMPTNDIVARGYAYLNINLNDVAPNECDETWSNRVHRIYGAGKPDDWGTIAAWAWGVSRVMDWIERQPELDATRVGVMGHSRGGKTALWAAAQDERIALAIPNGSGTGGARLLAMDLPAAEPLDWMLGGCIKHWYCDNMQHWFARTTALPHDADDLIRLVCPRLVYVGSGSGDDWAGPRGEFESVRRASDLWRAYGKEGLAIDQFPKPGSWSNEGSVGYMLHDGPHRLTAWNWARVLDFADRHLKRKPGEPFGPFPETAGKKPPAPRTPVAKKPVSDGLHGRVLGLYDRVDPSNARGYETPAPALSLVGWKGERVHAQVVVWSDADQGELAVTATPFSDVAFSSRFLRTVHAQCRPRQMKYSLVGDCLDAGAKAWPAEGYRVVWMTFDIPRTASAGDYAGEVTVAGATGKRVFRVALKVVDRTLPDYGGRKFFLDLWQHPWNVADHYGDPPFSDAHFAHLEPIYRELARAGQRVILTSIVDLPWGEGYNEGGGMIRSMVDYTYDDRRGYVADFTRFDRYVEFAKKCGMGPQIHCYTIVKFNSKHIFYYTDGKTGERRAIELYEGKKAYEEFLTPLLRQLQKHLEEKGWMDDAYIAVDEVPPERLKAPIDLLKRVAPKFKFALASNVDPMRYRTIDPDVDVMSQILWKNEYGLTNIFNAAYDAFRAKRRARGQLTTFYVCTEPQKPNTWLESPLAETAWIGLYAAAKNYDGFLRWAVVLWPKDPWNYVGSDLADMPAGEVQLLYPDGLVSSRWEILRDGIEDWEKIRLLREKGAVTPELQAAMDELDWEAVNTDPEDVTRRKVEAVQNLLCPTATPKATVENPAVALERIPDVRLFKGTSTSAYRDPTVVYDKGRFHLFMTFVASRDDQVSATIVHASSADIVRWTEPTPLFPADPKLNYSSPGNVVRDGDAWVLCFQSYPRPGARLSDCPPKYGNADCRLYVSRTRDFVGWSNPELLKVKGPGVAPADMGRMIDPYLVRDRDGLWHCFFKQGGASHSTSRNLREWTFCGRVDAGENVCVIPMGDGGWRMMHSPKNGMAMKRSQDLLKWDDEPGLITLGQSNWLWAKGRITAGTILDARNIRGVGRYLLFFHGSGPRTENEGDFDRNASVGIAWSDDMITWQWPEQR